jgi:hypothetical protein
MLGIAGNPPPLSLRMWAGPLDLIQHLFDPQENQARLDWALIREGQERPTGAGLNPASPNRDSKMHQHETGDVDRPRSRGKGQGSAEVYGLTRSSRERMASRDSSAAKGESRSVAPYLYCSVDPSIYRSVTPLLGDSLALSISRSVDRSIGRLVDRSFATQGVDHRTQLEQPRRA